MDYSKAYSMEELVPVVADLSFKYTGGDSTSITYEKADQLMEAVLYCITLTEMGNTLNVPSLSGKDKLSAREAYKAGFELLKIKVKKALNMYNEIFENFDDYNNRCLHDTFIKGMPEFFKRYDIFFAPQDAILLFDYPVLTDLTKQNGVLKVQTVLNCIWAEQRFLKGFDRNYVISLLSEYDSDYREMIGNIPEILKICFDRISDDQTG